MRRIAVPTLVLALALAACGSSSSSTPAAGSAAGSAVGSAQNLPAVTGAAGAKPAIAAPRGAQPKALLSAVITPGTGAAVASGDLIFVNYLGMTWTGKEFDNSFDRKEPFSFSVGSGGVIKGWDQGLVGQKVGSRVLLGIPSDLGYGAKGSPPEIPGDTALLFVVDVLGAYPLGAKASGAAVSLDDPALPKVTGDGASLAVTMTSGVDKPAQLVVKTLVQGTGPAVAAGQQIVVQYLGALWDGGAVFDASWKRNGAPISFAIGAGKVIKGWDEGLVGTKAGSRVLLVIPSDKAYGDAGRPPTIPAKATLVFVVDVLGSH